MRRLLWLLALFLSLGAAPAAGGTFVLPSLRLTAGPAALLPGGSVGAAVNLQAGVILRPVHGRSVLELLDWGPIVWVDGGYHGRPATAPSEPNLHLGGLGLAGGYGSIWIAADYGARFVAGSSDGQLALGLRHGAALNALFHVLRLEVAHQLLAVAGQIRHELQLTLGLDVGMILGGALLTRLPVLP